MRHVAAITRVSGLWRLFPPRCVPVFLEAETADHFYNGYCNNVLWPLLHYIPLSMLDAQAQLTETQWAAYQRANKDFADTVPPPCSPAPSRRQASHHARGARRREPPQPLPTAAHAPRQVMSLEPDEDDLVWVQDYHLMLLPRFLRERMPSLSIGWFLHTPFCTSEVRARDRVRANPNPNPNPSPNPNPNPNP